MMSPRVPARDVFVPDESSGPALPSAEMYAQGTNMDLKAEQRKIVRNSVAALVFCALALAGGYATLPLLFQFPDELIDRVAFVLQADVFVFLWIVFGIRMVARRRFHSAADNRGSAFGPPSPAIAVPVAFLQNTAEQAIIAVGAHLALATLLSGAALALIPTAIVLFAVGRLTFLIGYPKGAAARAFGIVATAIPTVGGYILAIALIAAQF